MAGSKAPETVNPKISEVKKALGTALPQLKSCREARTEINDEIREILDGLEESHGLNRKAVNDALKYASLPDGQKDGYDRTYEVVREVMGAPWQPDLFKTKKAEDESEPAAASDDAKGSADQDASPLH